MHIAPHHGFPFDLQDIEHIIRPPALVALTLGFHPVGEPGTRAASFKNLTV
jgi:hypothetical protein